MKIDIYDSKGAKSKELVLNSEIFWVEPNIPLMHKLLVLQRANARYVLAKTLNKWDVNWGWKKPYKQKWTWRARQWSIRNPHYIWWGVAHWPEWECNFAIKMPKKARRAALFWYLSDKAKKNNIFGLESYKWDIKTKNFAELLGKLPHDKKLLIVLWEKNSSLTLSARNIPWVKVILVQYLNPVDLTTHKKLCFFWDSLEKLEQTFLNN